MNQAIRINIAGIEPTVLDTLRNKYDNLKIIRHNMQSTIQVQVSKTFQEDFLINTLDEFLNNFNAIRKHEFTPNWYFDEHNSIITGPEQSFKLTKREVLFLKMLLSNDKIITYKKMFDTLWEGDKEVSQNAMRLFTRNIKKKLPSNVLRNFHNKGYKLVV